MDKAFELRHAEHRDLDRLLHLLHQLSPPKGDDLNVPQNQLRVILDRMIKDENYHVCVLEQDGELLGTGTLLLQLNLSHGGKPYAHIENIVVDNRHRKKGVGRKIVEHLLEKAREKNCYKVILSCTQHHIPFYGKCGLKKQGIEMRVDL